MVVKVNSNGHFLLDMIGHDKKRTSATKDKLGWSQFFSSICFFNFRIIVHWCILSRRNFSVQPKERLRGGTVFFKDAYSP